MPIKAHVTPHAGREDLVSLLRVPGARTLGKLNAFDFIVTAAFGSTLGTILLNSDVAFLEGLMALALPAGLQSVVWASAVWASTHVPGTRTAVTARPVTLVVGGKLQQAQAHRNCSAGTRCCRRVRSTGSGGLSGLAAVVLETSGSISVTPISRPGNGSALKSAHDLPGSGNP